MVSFMAAQITLNVNTLFDNEKNSLLRQSQSNIQKSSDIPARRDDKGSAKIPGQVLRVVSA